MTRSITVQENGTPISYTFDDILKYHGPGFPGGVAHAFKVMERTFPLLADGAPVERRSLAVETSFAGPGGRDAFEMVTRAVSRDAYRVDPGLGDPWRDQHPRQRYFFRVILGDRRVEAVVRPGLVRDEFVALGAKAGRTAEEEARLTHLKKEMADRLLPMDPAEVYELLSPP